MSTAKQLSLLSVEDYLAGELISPIKHEYSVAGMVIPKRWARGREWL